MVQNISFDTLPQAVYHLSNKLDGIEHLLHECINKNGNNGEQWLNIDELCNYLPDRPAKKTIYQWVSNKTIPYYKGTKALRFHKPEIDTWLKEGKVETQQEIIAQLNNGCVLPIKRRGCYA
jgi:excisionase family DNA binding protein